jgi:hypothetical protein
VGEALGLDEGVAVGVLDGEEVGELEGDALGEADGLAEGVIEIVGPNDGVLEGLNSTKDEIDGQKVRLHVKSKSNLRHKRK